MADPAYFGSASVPADNGSNATGQLTITPPASMLRGDLIVVEVRTRTTSFPVATFGVGVTGGQSWTQNNYNAGKANLFWCTFNGTWAADPRFDCSLSACVSAVMHVFRGRGETYIWEQDVAISTAGITAPVSDCPISGITTATEYAIAMAGWNSDSAHTWGSLTGTDWLVAGDAQYRNTAQSDQSLSYAYKLMPTAGLTGGTQKTKSSSSGRYDAWIMAFKNSPTNNLFPPVLTQTKTLYVPEVTQALNLQPPTITRAKTLSAPMVLASNELAPPVLTQAKVLLAPAVNLGDVQNLLLPAITRDKTLLAPEITTSGDPQTLLPPLITRTKTLVEPTVINQENQTLLMPLLRREAQPLVPVVTGGVPRGAGGGRPVVKKRVVFRDRDAEQAALAAQQEAERVAARAVLEGIADEMQTQYAEAQRKNDDEVMILLLSAL